VDPVVAVRRGGRRKGSGKRADGTAPWALRAIQALSDGSRWAIVQYLSEHEATVGSIARQQGLSVACTSKHLSILSECGLIEVQRSGREARCRLARAGSEASDLLAALGVHDRVEARESAVEAPAEWRGSAPELEPSRRPKVIRYQSNDLDDYLL
jgi:DNA-binding transcriptional ArsR family regulator